MDYYFVFKLSERVPTACFPKGSDTCICKAKSEEDARAQLLPQMREKVLYVRKNYTMQECYSRSTRVLDELVY